MNVQKIWVFSGGLDSGYSNCGLVAYICQCCRLRNFGSHGFRFCVEILEVGRRPEVSGFVLRVPLVFRFSLGDSELWGLVYLALGWMVKGCGVHYFERVSKTLCFVW